MGNKYKQITEVEVLAEVPNTGDQISVLYYQFDKQDEVIECVSNLMSGVQPFSLVEIRIRMNELE